MASKGALLVAVVVGVTVLGLARAQPAVSFSAVTVTRFDDPSGPGSCPTSCSLRQALLSIDAGGTITLPAGTYTLTRGNDLFASDVTIVGAGARSTIIDQTVAQERVLEVDNGTVSITGVTLTGGDGVAIADSEDGGGIWTNTGTTLDLNDSTVTGNSASEFGGGVYAQGDLNIDGSTIADNTSSAGAGVNFVGGTATIVNSAISGNDATGPGASDASGSAGGVFASGPTTLTNDTIADNEADFAEGIDILNTATVSATNTIVAGPTSTLCFNPLDDLGHNIASDTSCTGTASDPLLGSLQDNGGETDTLLPGAGSPAIDNGDDGACPTTDQRGISRPQGAHCDVGSVEVAASGPPTASAALSMVHASPSSVIADGSSTSTITVTLYDTNGDPMSGKTVTLQANGGSSAISAASGPTSASGVVTFAVSDSVAESVVYTATDATDGVTITQTATATFTAPVAAGGGGSTPSSPTPAPAPTAVVVPPAPTASFTYAVSGDTVTFDASASRAGSADFPIAVYEWNFGDGTPFIEGVSPRTTHTFATFKSYSVTLTVVEAQSIASASVTEPVTIPVPPLHVTFGYQPATPWVGAKVTLTANATGGADGRVAYTWSFGDGDRGTGPRAIHTFDTEGNRRITVTATEGAQSASHTEEIYVRDVPAFGRSVTGAVEVLRQFGPGMDDPSGPADSGLTVFLGGARVPSATTTTDANGSYRFTGLPAAASDAHGNVPRTSITVRNDHHETIGGTDEDGGGIPFNDSTPGITAEPTITVAPAADDLLIKGTVTPPTTTAKPPPSITVTAESLDGTTLVGQTSATSHGYGLYRLVLPKGADGGGIRLTLKENGTVVDRHDLDFFGPVHTTMPKPGQELAAPDLHAVFPVAAYGRSVTGNVEVLRPFGPGKSDPSVPAAGVRAWLGYGTAGGVFTSTTTNANGVYRFADLAAPNTSHGPPRTAITVTDEHNRALGAHGGDGSGVVLNTEDPGVTSEPTIGIAPASGDLLIAGTVVAPAETPKVLPRITVRAEGFDGTAVVSQTAESSKRFGGYRLDLPQGANVSRVHLSLVEGTTDVDAADIDFFGSGRYAQPKPGQELSAPDLHAVFPITADGRSVVGAVELLLPFGPGMSDPSGPAGSGLTVFLRGTRVASATATTDADGDYRFTNLPAAPGTPTGSVPRTTITVRNDHHQTIGGTGGNGSGVPFNNDTPGITAEPTITVAPAVDDLLIKGTVTPPATIRDPRPTITVTAESFDGTVLVSQTSATSHGYGLYRLALPKGADGGRIHLTLEENGTVVDSRDITLFGAHPLPDPGEELAAPDLHG